MESRSKIWLENMKWYHFTVVVTMCKLDELAGFLCTQQKVLSKKSFAKSLLQIGPTHPVLFAKEICDFSKSGICCQPPVISRPSLK